jgi:hypothetical protein
MSSTTEHQKETPSRSDSVSPTKDDDGTHLSKPDDGMPSPAKQTGSAKNELASQLAALKVTDKNANFDIEEEKAVDKTSDDEFFSDEEAELPVEVDENTATPSPFKSDQDQVEHPVKVDETTYPKLPLDTAPKLENAGSASMERDEETTTSKSGEEQASHSIEANENTKPKFATETARKLEVTSNVSVRQTEVDATTSKSEEEQASHQTKVNENTKPKHSLEIAPNLEDTISVPNSKLTYEAAPKPEAAGSASAKTTKEVNSDTITPDVPTDETDTPRLSAYIKLHNDVSSLIHIPNPPHLLTSSPS